MSTPECPATDGSSPRTTRFSGKPPMCIDSSKRYSAVMSTSVGDLSIALDAAGAPLTVNNFVFLARHHYYDSLTFHRPERRKHPDCCRQRAGASGSPGSRRRRRKGLDGARCLVGADQTPVCGDGASDAVLPQPSVPM